ncbi:MAG: phage tail assembly chaperone [Erythrobacter sp.]|nr:phage tail assembly chaperone [Erythrobacter sp.]
MTRRFSQELPALVSLAARLLHWRPHEFWSATPAELAMALIDPQAIQAQLITRQTIEQLMERERNGRSI